MAVLRNIYDFVSRPFRRAMAGEDTSGGRETAADKKDAQGERERLATYTTNELFYSGQIYRPRQYGGDLEGILRTYLNRAQNPSLYPIAGHFNPVPEVVDAFQNVFPGSWGEIGIADERPNGEPVNPKLAKPMGELWRGSNFDTNKQKWIRWAANLGTAGLKVTATADGASVFLEPLHPERISDFERDDRQNIVWAVLKWTAQVNRNKGPDARINPDYEDVEVIEEIAKDGFSKYLNGRQVIPDAGRKNTLGFCPVVISVHKDNGTRWGDWAYRGTEAAIHRINWRISRQDVGIERHQFPKFLLAAGGPAPTEVPFGDGEKVMYVEMKPDTPPPIAEALIAKLDHPAFQAFWTALRDQLRGQLPVLTINDVRLLAGISGETIAQVLKPAESDIGRARPLYLHAATRALQMGLSVGSELGLWDVGAGTGPGSGDRAYKAGLLDFQFAPMPLLPQTVFQQEQQAKAAVADKRNRAEVAKALVGVSTNERLRVQGYSKKQITAMEAEIKTQDVLDADDGEEDGDEEEGDELE